MTREPFGSRLERFRRVMMEKGMGAFLVCVPENRYYLSGYGEEDLQLTESSGYVLITQSGQYIVTDFRYRESASSSAPDYEVVIYSEGPAQVLAELLQGLGAGGIGVEGHHLTHEKYLEVEAAVAECCPDARLISQSGLVEEMRIIKDADEITRIKASLRVTENALREVWEKLAVGAKEKDIAWAIERSIREQGAEAVSFPPIVASGPNGALPHAVPSDRRIGEGDAVILDLGARLDHYCSDMTRTWIAGTPGDKLREIYKVVREAQCAAMSEIRPGMETVAIDGMARSVIDSAGYGDFFGHGLGHGVGLAVHEKPGLRKRNPLILEENMVVTVEPGIYLSGYGGVRLENMVRVTKAGCEVLNELDLFYSF